MKTALYVGRVGALAIALGIGAGICGAGFGVARADNADAAGPGGMAGPRADAAPRGASPRDSDKKPAPARAAVQSAPQPAVARVSAGVFGTGPDNTGTSPADWVMLAVARRQLGTVGRATAPPSAAVTTGSVNAPPVIATGVGGSPSPVAVVAAEDYVLIRRADLMAKPTSGAGWNYLKSQADALWETPDLSRLNTKTPAMVMAAGLVYARTGDTKYQDKVIAALKAVPGTEAKATEVLPFARNIFGYVVAADLVDMPLDTVANNGQTWRAFLEGARSKQFTGNTRWISLEKTAGDSASNWNAYALSSHLVISTVLGDTTAVDRDITIYRRFLGDVTSPWPAFAPTAGYTWNGNGRTWDMTQTLQRGINPDKPGDSRSGAIILDASRHTWLPSVRWGRMDLAGRAYTEETLDALLAVNMVLRAQGVDFTDFQNQALRRAYAFLVRNGGPSGYSNGRYLALAINNMYGTTFNTSAGDSVARHLGYGGWLLTR